MSTQIEPAVSTELAITGDQTRFTDTQVAMLRQIGVEDASPADLAVFFHHCKRTGLDPFARQIYMIGRNTEVSVRVDLGDGASRVEKRRVMKYTIQTGIDGYRLIGKRAMTRENALVSHDSPGWMGKDDVWRDYWNPADGTPVAARYTIRVNGAPYTATCMFNEFAQYNSTGELTSMWKKMPANQLLKCAESAAWRKAFPADFADIHENSSWQVIDDEGTMTPMPAPGRLTEADIVGISAPGRGHTGYVGRDGVLHVEKQEQSEPAGSRQTAPMSSDSAARQDHDPHYTAESPDLRDPAPTPEPPASKAQNTKINALFDDLGLPKSHRDDRLAVIAHILGYKPHAQLTAGEALKLAEKLLDWLSDPQTPSEDRIRDILNAAALREADAAVAANEEGVTT